MKRASIREFRSRLAEFLEGTDPVLVDRHGQQVAIVYPLHDPRKVPVEVRREVVDSLAHRFGLPGDLEVRSGPVEVYKRDVDRTLIRENLRRTPEERLRALQGMQTFAEEVRRAGRKRR